MEQYYQIYGLGNALVDIDFEVGNETLARLEIDKGVMTLIDHDRHHQLLEELDGIKHVRACGGSCANTMIAFSQFGGTAFYSCLVADDSSGKFFITDLEDHGVATSENFLAKDNSLSTGKCIVLITPDADRTMNTYLGVTQGISREQVSPEALKNSKFLYLEGYLVTSESGKDAAMYAHELARNFGIKTALTLSDPNMTTHFRQGLMEMIEPGVNFLFSNEEEALTFTDTSSLEDAIEGLKAFAEQFVITQGSKGSLIFNGQKIIKIPAHPTSPLDTVGAGDMYAAGILYGLTHNLPLEAAGHLGSLAAAKVIQKYGPRLTLAESDQVLKQFHRDSLEAYK